MSLRPAIFALLTALPFVSATPVHAQNKLIVGMPTTPPNIVLMPLHVGKDLGFFKQEGIDIETVELEGGVKAFRAMVAGSVDIASSPGPFSIVGRAKGAVTKMLVSNSPKLEVSMVVQKDINMVSYKIVAADNGDAWVEAQGKKMAPPEVSAGALRKTG